MRILSGHLYPGGCSVQSPVDWIGAEHSAALTCGDAADYERIPFIPPSDRIDSGIALPMPSEIHGSYVLRLIAGDRPAELVAQRDGPTIHIDVGGATVATYTRNRLR